MLVLTDGSEFKATLAPAMIEAPAVKIFLKGSFSFQRLLFMSMTSRI